LNTLSVVPTFACTTCFQWVYNSVKFHHFFSNFHLDNISNSHPRHKRHSLSPHDINTFANWCKFPTPPITPCRPALCGGVFAKRRKKRFFWKNLFQNVLTAASVQTASFGGESSSSSRQTRNAQQHHEMKTRCAFFTDVVEQSNPVITSRILELAASVVISRHCVKSFLPRVELRRSVGRSLSSFPAPKRLVARTRKKRLPTLANYQIIVVYLKTTSSL
jgi:hypothetical protein